MGDDESRRRDILARIGASIRDAQYALTVNSPRRVQNAVSETQMAIIALSEYLALPNGIPKAAAVAKRIAKVLGSVISLLRHSDSGAGSTTQCEIEPADKPPSHESSFPNLFDEDSDVHELLQLREKLASTQEERDSFVALLRDAQQEVASLKESVADPTHGLSLHTVEIERVNSENKALKELLQEEILKSKALAETVRESNEKLQKISHENATTQALLEQHRRELKEKEQEIAANVRAASKAAIMNPKPIDNEEIEALQIQVKLMRQALRECINNSSAAEIKAGKKTLVDIENEHQDQLMAMKITLETQCKRENNYTQQIDDLKNFIEEIEKDLERERLRAEDAERCAHDTAGTVEQRHREQLATLEAALEQQRAQHASEVDDLRVALEHERQRAEDAERCAHDTAGTVEQRHREQLATLEAALEQQRAQHASEVDDLRVALEHERQRAEDAERCAHDTAGTVEQRHREQLATLEAALEQQRAQHASEVDDLRVALEHERQRAEDAERCAHNTAGTVEQRHREQLATLEAALEQQRAQHASEVDDLRVALEHERQRAEDAERCAHDTAGTVEQRHREQLATLEAALEQQRAQHASEVDDLRVALEHERQRAEDAERCAHDTAGTVEQRHREQLATLEAALEQQRAQHASEVDDLRVALEHERQRAGDAERCAHDTAGTVEQRHREQLATLEAALEQQRAQHASEVDDLRVALEHERQRAEDAERCAHNTAGTVEQRHREQLATLEAALEQQRAQHASEVDDLRVALEHERQRAEDAERCAHDTAGTVEQRHREQLATLEAALEQQRAQHASEVDDLRVALEHERQRAEDAERCAHDTAGTVEQRHREQLATLEAALEQQRAQHASEVDDLRVALEHERQRAEDAERCAHDTAGTVEQRHREQLATLEAALEQQRAQHASEVDDLRVALEHERQRAEDAERCAHNTAGTVEQRHREQLATLEAALEQQRAQHASEVDDLRVALEHERQRAEDAERCAHDTAGTVEQRHREQLATLEAALEQQRAQHASEVDDLRVALEHERQRAEDAERCAHDTAGTVEQRHREQLATLEAALEQQRAQHASEVDDLRVALEHERQRAGDAERCAHDTAGTVEQRHREQLATLEAALEQQRAQHASEVDDLRVALEHERQRAEDAERCAHNTAGTVEQRHREQLATLEAALEQQRAQHASEVDDLRVALEHERQRAEDAERCAHDTAGTVEQRHREQLATLEAALEQQRAQHASEVDDLRVALEHERQRAEDAERCAHNTPGTVEQRHREQLATLEAALEQQRAQHASEVDDLRVALERERQRAEERVVVVEKQLEDAVMFYRGEVEKVKSLFAADRGRMNDKLSSVSRFLDEATKEADGLRNKVKIFEEENRQLRLKCEGTRDALTESEVALREERRSLMGEVSLLRSRCLALEQEVAAAVELSSERAESVNRLMQQLAEAKSMVANSLHSDSAKIAGTSVSLEEWVHFLRGVVVADLKRAARGVVVVNEETQDIVNLARDLRSVIDHTAGLSVQVTRRQRQLTQILNVVAAKQCVALRKIQQCLLGSVSLQETDAAILEACLLLFNDVESALSEVAEPELKDADKSASLTPVKDERDALLQRTLRRARNRVNENTSSPLSSHGVQPVLGSMITPVKTRGTSSGMRPSSERKFLSSPEGGHTSVSRTKASPHNSRGPPEHLSRMDVGQCSEDPFDYAVATLSAQEKQYDRRQHSMPPRRWLTPGKKGSSTRAGL
ncbi:hypothetical protein C3747_121g25 [Trypanosoma cruzi]|uniref:Uncharacterized protein n=1 Tax=Trypanosoma cruzi TaxID=5693 RepID=A0A2V2WBL0_TRYCR|nr:hypothetical protein C3747_121g25 [Trypanosoma cruzi]